MWNDLNMDGINDPDEPGIPGVSLVIWSDPDGDGTPDWEGFGGVEVTDEDGYYRFDGLAPGNYVVFVWQVDNWGDGEPLNGFQSTGYSWPMPTTTSTSTTTVQAPPSATSCRAS